MVEKIQRVEGLAILLAALFFYAYMDTSWLMFFVLFLVPDIFMIGYLRNNKIGADIYNLGHSLVLPIVLITIAYALDNQSAIGIGVIWLAHIGADRAAGYGLKKEDNFKHTHLGWVGKSSIVSNNKE